MAKVRHTRQDRVILEFTKGEAITLDDLDDFVNEAKAVFVRGTTQGCDVGVRVDDGGIWIEHRTEEE